MKLDTRNKTRSLLLFLLIGQRMVIALASSSVVQDGSSNDGETSVNMDTCERTKVSTYSHKFSQQWAINNVSAIFNRTYLDDDGVAHILDTFTLEDQFGANWTFQLNSPYHNRLKIVFNATMLTDDGGDNLVNLITGDGIVVFDGNDTTTSPFGCGIASSSRPDNLTTLWSGSCLEYFDEAELAKMAHNHSLTVTVKLQIVYANYSQIVAKGKGCQAGRLNAFNRPQFTTRKNDNDEGFRDSRGKLHAKVQMHRVSLEWSVPDLYEALQEPQGIQGGWLQSLKLVGEEGLVTGWSMTASIFRDLSGKEISVQLSMSSVAEANVLTIRGLQVAITTCQDNSTSEVPFDGITGYDLWKEAIFLITDDDLKQWQQGVTVLLKYEVLYEIKD